MAWRIYAMTKENTHPSYGMVGLSRRHGHIGKLFASNIDNQHSITIEVFDGAWEHKYGADRYFADNHAPIIEVEMSPAQFADLVTTFNVGSGVPCTIRSFNRQRRPPVPSIDTESERVQDCFDDEMKKLADTCQASVTRVRELTAKPTLTKADRKEISDMVGQAMMAITSNIPFMMSQFREATERVVTSAKAEVEAALMQRVVTLGVDALRNTPTALNEPEAPELLLEQK